MYNHLYSSQMKGVVFMKKRITILLTIFFILILPIFAYASDYVGNARTHKFHYAWTCQEKCSQQTRNILN